MRPTPTIVLLFGLAAGCASSGDRNDGATVASFEPREGRPGREGPSPFKPAAGAKGESWWDGLLGGILGGDDGGADDFD